MYFSGNRKFYSLLPEQKILSKRIILRQCYVYEDYILSIEFWNLISFSRSLHESLVTIFHLFMQNNIFKDIYKIY